MTGTLHSIGALAPAPRERDWVARRDPAGLESPCSMRFERRVSMESIFVGAIGVAQFPLIRQPSSSACRSLKEICSWISC